MRSRSFPVPFRLTKKGLGPRLRLPYASGPQDKWWEGGVGKKCFFLFGEGGGVFVESLGSRTGTFLLLRYRMAVLKELMDIFFRTKSIYLTPPFNKETLKKTPSSLLQQCSYDSHSIQHLQHSNSHFFSLKTKKQVLRNENQKPTNAPRSPLVRQVGVLAMSERDLADATEVTGWKEAAVKVVKKRFQGEVFWRFLW